MVLFPPEHGGNLRKASVEFGIPPEAWLDLSTGINPFGWHVKNEDDVDTIPQACWSRLPEEDDSLEDLAAAFYGVSFRPLCTAGSQAAIQSLPGLRQTTGARVAVVSPSYAEHAYVWRLNGHSVVENSSLDLLETSLEREQYDIVIVVHPNNPTGETISTERLLRWRHHLTQRDGWLIVDEAFMDATPEQSVVASVDLNAMPGLIVLRSLGKFFGLAGARIGFLLAERTFLKTVKTALGPWCIAGPSRWIARKALADTAWQKKTRHDLPEISRRLSDLLRSHGLRPTGGTALFQWISQPPRGHAFWWLELAKRGILVRRFPEFDGLRFGLPGEECHWRRLENGLNEIR